MNHLLVSGALPTLIALPMLALAGPFVSGAGIALVAQAEEHYVVRFVDDRGEPVVGVTILAGFEVYGHATVMPMSLVHESGFRFESKDLQSTPAQSGVRFAGLPPGRYEVIAGRPGSVKVTVAEGDDVTAFVRAGASQNAAKVTEPSGAR